MANLCTDTYIRLLGLDGYIYCLERLHLIFPLKSSSSQFDFKVVNISMFQNCSQTQLPILLPSKGNVWDNTCNPYHMQFLENVSDCMNLMPHQINGSATILDWDSVMLLFQSCQSTSVVLQKIAMSYFSSLRLMMEIQSMGPWQIKHGWWV